jgi:restriction system protein
MPVPDYETLMLPVLRAFGAGATSVRDCLPSLMREFAITEAEAEMLLPSGTTSVLSSRAHWARTYLSKAGLIRSPRRGVHQITPRGEELLKSAPIRIDNAFLRSSYGDFNDWLKTARSPRGPGDPSANVDILPEPAELPSAPPDEVIRTAHAEMEAALADDLLAQLQTMNPVRFEKVVLDLLGAMGYGTGDFGTSMTTRASGDGGIDGIIHEDALGLDAVYIQAKRYAPENKVSRPAIQQFVGSLTGEGATKGVFVTTSGFSAEARDYLRRVQHRIVLIDGPELARRMIRHGVGVRVRETVTIKGIDADYFDEG